MARIVVSENELFEALELAAPGKAPENARTMEELTTIAGMGRTAVTRRMKQLQRDGRVVVHWVTRSRLDGQVNRVPAYTFLPTKKGGKA